MNENFIKKSPISYAIAVDYDNSSQTTQAVRSNAAVQFAGEKDGTFEYAETVFLYLYRINPKYCDANS
jgi:hypothetical protein